MKLSQAAWDEHAEHRMQHRQSFDANCRVCKSRQHIERRTVTFYFITPLLLLVEQRWLTVRKDKQGREYVMAALKGSRVRVHLDTSTEVFITKEQR